MIESQVVRNQMVGAHGPGGSHRNTMTTNAMNVVVK